MDQQNTIPVPEPALSIPSAPATPPSGQPGHTPSSAEQKKSKKGAIIGTIIGALVLLTGGTYAAAYFGYISLPISVPGIQNDIIAGSLEDWLDNDVSDTTTDVALAVETRDSSIPSVIPTGETSTVNSSTSWLPVLIPAAHAQATTFSIESIGSQLGLPDLTPGQSSFSPTDILPDNLAFNASFTTYAEKTSGLGKTQVTGSAEGTFGDTEFSFDAEVRQVEKDVYVQMKKLTGLPTVDPAKILGKWYAMNADDASALVPVTSDTDSEKAVKEAKEAANQALTIAQQKKLFTTKKNFGPEDIGGTSTQHTSHVINPKNVVPFAEAWLAARKEAGKAVDGADDMLAELKKPASITIIENISKALTIDLWYDAGAKRIKKMSVKLVVVPPAGSTKFTSNQFVLTVSTTINSVGVKMTIDVPSPVEPIENAQEAISFGDSTLGTNLDAERKSHLAMIQTGLALYYDDNNAYPTALTQLAPTYLAILPSDPLTDAAYSYDTCAGNHYLLSSIQDDAGGSFYVDDLGTSKQSLSPLTCGQPVSTTNTNSSSQTTINSPTNTSTDPDPLADTDQDGLEDFLEAIYGSDINKADTDGDGYSDGEEVDNGYSPTGPGKI